MTVYKTKVLEPVGSVNLTIADLAFINQIFGVVSRLGTHIEILNADTELTILMGSIVALGNHTRHLANDLSKLHSKNSEEIYEFMRQASEDSARITAKMMIAGLVNGLKDGKEPDLDGILGKLINYAKENGVPLPTDQQLKEAGLAGYQ